MTNFDYNEILQHTAQGIQQYGFIEYIKLNWMNAIVTIVGFFAIVAAFIPNKSGNKYLNLALKLVNAFGCNFGKAKNKD